MSFRRFDPGHDHHPDPDSRPDHSLPELELTGAQIYEAGYTQTSRAYCSVAAPPPAVPEAELRKMIREKSPYEAHILEDHIAHMVRNAWASVAQKYGLTYRQFREFKQTEREKSGWNKIVAENRK